MVTPFVSKSFNWRYPSFIDSTERLYHKLLGPLYCYTEQSGWPAALISYIDQNRLQILLSPNRHTVPGWRISQLQDWSEAIDPTWIAATIEFSWLLGSVYLGAKTSIISCSNHHAAPAAVIRLFFTSSSFFSISKAVLFFIPMGHKFIFPYFFAQNWHGKWNLNACNMLNPWLFVTKLILQSNWNPFRVENMKGIFWRLFQSVEAVEELLRWTVPVNTVPQTTRHLCYRGCVLKRLCVWCKLRVVMD